MQYIVAVLVDVVFMMELFRLLIALIILHCSACLGQTGCMHGLAGSGFCPAPTIDKVQYVSKTAVGVTWTVPCNNTSEEFHVFAHSDGEILEHNVSGIDANVITGGEIYTIRIAGLQPGVNYSFQVQAIDDMGDVCNGTVHHPSWTGSAPTTNITGFTATATGPTMVDFTWSSPGSNVRLSCYTSNNFIVFIKDYSASQTTTDTGDDDLKPFTNYYCDISAVNGIDDENTLAGQNSSLTVQTLEAAPGSPPTSVRVEAAGPTRVQVTWGPPRIPNGIITHYNLYINNNPIQVTPDLHGEADTETYVFTTDQILEPYKNVTVQISAETKAGEGLLSYPQSVVTDESASGEVSHLLVSPLDDSSLAVSWGEPEQPYGVIVHYQYTVYDDRWSELNNSQVAASSGNEYIIRVNNGLLAPYIAYTVRVFAVNGAGNGSYEDVVFYIKEKVPEAPTIDNLIRNDRTATVTWSVRNTEDPIMGYAITYETLYTAEIHFQRMTKDVSPEISQTEIYNLNANLTYTVTVTAYNSAGDGNTSEPMTLEPFIPTTGVGAYSLFVQIRLSGVADCSQWLEDHQIEELTSAITNRMSFICPTCDYTTTIEWLTETVILCSSQRDQLLLRTIPQCPHDNCYAHFEFWLSLQYQFLKLYNGQILLVDPTCPLYVDSLDSCECRETTSCAAATSSNGGPIATSSIGGPIATSSPGGATATSSLGGAIAGSLIGGLALGCLIWLPVLISVLFYFIKYRPAEKDSEKMSIDLNIQPPKRYTKPQVDDQVSYETVGYFQETDDKYFVDTPPSGISAVQRKKLLMKSVSVGPPARGIRHHAAEEEDNSEYEIPDIGPQETSHDVVHYDYPFHPLPHQKPATAPVTPKTKSTDRISKSQKPSASQTQKLQSIPQASGQNPQLHSKPAASIGPAASHQKQQVPPKSAETKSTDQPSTSQKPSASQTQKLQSIPQASGQNPRFHSKVSVAIGAHHKQPLPPLADQKEKDTKPAPKAKKLINFQFKLPAAALDHEQPQAIKLPPMKPKQEATKGPPKSARVLPPIQMTKNPEVGTDCKQEASRAKETVPMKKDNTISTEQTPGKKRPILPPGVAAKPRPPEQLKADSQAKTHPPTIKPKPLNRGTGPIPVKPNLAYTPTQFPQNPTKNSN